jgi:D-aminopeptidase
MIRRMGSTERWRDIAGPVGRLQLGPRNAITDVPGVKVGHAQAASGDRTGATVIVPPGLPAPAGTRTVNGTGELTGKLEIDEVGRIETPVYLCGTHAVGTAYQAGVDAAFDGGRSPDNFVIPVVGECDDSDLADARKLTADDVHAALAAAGPEVAEGNVGAGTGMQCFDFPGGIGTASRVVGSHHVGVLLLCNFGEREYLDLLGTSLDPAVRGAQSDGSCISVCATDAPLSPHELRRLALRPLLGLARVGSYGSEGSGEIGMAFATGDGSGIGAANLNPIFVAAYEAAHEAVLNCLVAGTPATRRDGTKQDAFPIDLVRRIAKARA